MLWGELTEWNNSERKNEVGKEFIVTSLEEMCDLMCDNIVPKERNLWGKKKQANGNRVNLKSDTEQKVKPYTPKEK